MSRHTILVEFNKDDHPLYNADTKVLGGTVVAVGFYDALAELETVTEQRDELLEALEGFVKQWNACGQNSDFGRIFKGTRDSAVAAIAKATGAAK